MVAVERIEGAKVQRFRQADVIQSRGQVREGWQAEQDENGLRLRRSSLGWNFMPSTYLLIMAGLFVLHSRI